MKSTKQQFRLSGKTLNTDGLPAMVRRAVESLSKLPPGELLTTNEFASHIGYTNYAFSTNVSSHPAVKDYRLTLRYPRRVVWGNRKTIADLSTHKEIIAQ